MEERAWPAEPPAATMLLLLRALLLLLLSASCTPLPPRWQVKQVKASNFFDGLYLGGLEAAELTAGVAKGERSPCCAALRCAAGC